MPGFVQLVDEHGDLLHVEHIGTEQHLIVETHARISSHWKVASTTSAATTVIVQPKAGGSIVVTDIIAVQNKVASGSLIIQFTDGTNTEILFEGSSADAPIVLSHAFSGRMDGWQDARVEMISAGTNPTTNVIVVYFHLKGIGVKSYGDWDGER
tara:strand:- start:2281 stop:2742 length:462 start_codon:yes stop_codon:yes gene_type:complete